MKQKKQKKQTTIDWMDVQNYHDGTLILQYGKQTIYTKGVKVFPKNLLIENSNEQRIFMNSLRLVYNKIDFTTYQAFVAKPVDLSTHMYHLMRLEENEPREALKRLIQEDILKAKQFVEYMQEIEFFIFVRDMSEELSEQKCTTLLKEFKSAGFDVKRIDDNDIKHYLEYQFENKSISEMHYSRAYIGV